RQVILAVDPVTKKNTLHQILSRKLKSKNNYEECKLFLDEIFSPFKEKENDADFVKLLTQVDNMVPAIFVFYQIEHKILHLLPLDRIASFSEENKRLVYSAIDTK